MTKLTIAIIFVLIAGCSTRTSAVSKTVQTAGTINVFAASSLTDAFKAMLTPMREEGLAAVKVNFDFDSSSSLARQITAGAPADVFASADAISMKAIETKPLTVDSVKEFATNRLVIAVAKGNPMQIRSVADLARAGLTFVECVETAPCGKYSKQMLANARTTVHPASREINVKGVVTKVAIGEADAGIVYATDAKANPKLEFIEIPKPVNVVAHYFISRLRRAPAGLLGNAFVGTVISEAGQAILARFGFGPPGSS